MNREYHKWWSPALNREMELLRFGTGGVRVLVFPTRRQRFFEYEDHGMVHALRHSILREELQLICVDGIDDESLYCFDIEPEKRVARHLEYERHIVDEVIPFSKRFGRKAPLIAHGCSFGAYHAVTIALRYPEYFSAVVALSGRYDLTLSVGDYHTLFHGYYGDDLNRIMPSRFLPELSDARRIRKLRRLNFTLVVGEEDAFCENNASFARALAAKKIPHTLHFWCGTAHRFRYWRQMVRIYLEQPLSHQRFSPPEPNRRPRKARAASS
jgi:esterase/lipase superfamily enzyme